MLDFTHIAGFVMDMDGVLWRGDHLLPGATDLFDRLRVRGVPFVLATNNSSRSPADYVAKLTHLGIDGIGETQIVTSGSTTADYLRHHYPPETPVYVLGVEGLRRMVAGAGMTLVEDGARVVVSGAAFDLTYETLKRAALQIRAGADFIGTNANPTFPTPEGLAPGAGSILAALRTATGREPLVMGKPGLAMFETALHVLGTPAEATLMIGDRYDTDITGAQTLGLRTALVLTGVTTRPEAELLAVPPDGIYDGLPDLLHDWGA